MTTNILFSILIAISSIESLGYSSFDEFTDNCSFYSYQTTVSSNGTFDFVREFDYSIDDIVFESNDFVLNSRSISDGFLNISLSCDAYSLKHFGLNVCFTNGHYQYDIYCVYLALGMAFISSQSDEMAWQQMAIYAYQEGLYSLDDLERMYDEFLIDFVLTDLNSISTYSISHDGGSYGNSPCTYISGTLLYCEKVDENGIPDSTIPLKNIEVKLYIDGSNKLDGVNLKTTTNKDGYFIFYLTKYEYPSLYNETYHDYYIKCSTKGTTYKIVNGFDVAYSFNSETIENQKNNEQISIDCFLQKSKTSDTTKAFSIACGLGYGEEFILNYSKFPSDYNTITYVFPSALGNTWTYKTIGAFADKSAYDIGTALHEYGHYVEQSMGAFGRKALKAISSSHSLGDDLILRYEDTKGKEYAMMMAWDESLASVYSMIVCHYYEELLFSDFEFTENVLDKIDNANNFKNINESSGEGQERAIIAYLWNVFDGNNKYDSISFTEKEFLDLTFVDGMYTLQSFIENFENLYPNLMFESGSILEHCAIAPSIESVSYNASLRYFNISFIPNGSESNTNNLFNILFYDEEGALIDGIYGIEPQIDSNRTTTTYTIGKIVAVRPFITSYYSTVYVSIEGYLNTNPTSGPYRSSLVQLNASYGRLTI